jgi:hypothetical protein
MAAIATVRIAGEIRTLDVLPQVTIMAQGAAENKHVGKEPLPVPPDGDYGYWLPWLVVWFADRRRDRSVPFAEYLLDVDLDLTDTRAPGIVDAVAQSAQALLRIGEQAPPDPTPAEPSSG